jgi:hypothetical protein
MQREQIRCGENLIELVWSLAAPRTASLKRPDKTHSRKSKSMPIECSSIGTQHDNRRHCLTAGAGLRFLVAILELSGQSGVYDH